MDSFYHDLKKVGRLFDDVFGNVFSITSCEPSNPINVSTLNDHQLLNVYDGCKMLHEVLQKYRESRAMAASPHARKRKLSEMSDSCHNGCNRKVDSTVTPTTSDYEKEKKKTLVLREYLIQELNYSEKLELELLEKKEELANAIRREEISNKQHESRILELLAYNKEYRSDDGSTNESIIGHFVHKSFGDYGTFYGLIASFDHPYYKVNQEKCFELYEY